MRKLIYLTVILSLIGVLGHAQSLTIHGQVTDISTGEGIPFCSVFFTNSEIGSYTDEFGFFNLETDEKFDSLSITYIGYKNQHVKLSEKTIQEYNINLQPLATVLMTAVVIAGENPAHPIMRRVVKNKNKNQISSLGSHEYNSYSKIQIDLSNIDDKITSNKILKPFEFVFDYVDTTESNNSYLPFYLSESIFHIKQQVPSKKKSISTIASKSSGIDNKSVIEFLDDFQEEYNIYDDWIKIYSKPFAGPFSTKCFNNYEYYLLDSTMIKGEKYFNLKFKPKRKKENTFFGQFKIHASSFAVTQLEFQMNPEVNINFVEGVNISESFAPYKNSWASNKQVTTIHMKMLDKMPGMVGRKTIINSDYDFDEHKASKLEVNDLQGNRQNFLIQNRPEVLSEEEIGIYTMVDSLKNTRRFKTISEIFKVAFEGTKEFGPVEFGPYFSLTSNNVLEGQRFKFGAWTSKKLSKQFKFGGFVAYGLKDEQFKYGADVKWILNSSPRTVLSASYKNDNDLNSDSDFEVGEGNILASFLRRDIVQKLILDKKSKLSMEKYWENGLYTRATFVHNDMRPVANIGKDGSGFNYSYILDDNPDGHIKQSINYAEFSINLRYAPKEKFVDGTFKRRSLGSAYPIPSIQYGMGAKGILGSDYNYHKINFKLSDEIRLNPIGEFSYVFEMGKTFGRVPFLLTEVHRGNETYFLMKQAFNGMNRYEFASDQFALIKMEHHFDGFILNKLPLLSKLKWRSLVNFKAVIGSLSDKNKLANQENLFDPTRSKYIGVRAPSKVPYMEAGVGIENIFKIFRVDALWRLNYLDNPEAIPFAVKLGVEMRF